MPQLTQNIGPEHAEATLFSHRFTRSSGAARSTGFLALSLFGHSRAKWPGSPRLKHVPWGTILAGCCGREVCFTDPGFSAVN